MRVGPVTLEFARLNYAIVHILYLYVIYTVKSRCGRACSHWALLRIFIVGYMRIVILTQSGNGGLFKLAMNRHVVYTKQGNR